MGNGTSVKCTTVTAGSDGAKVWTAGQGDPLVLVHGGWGGAGPHWSAVWNQLAQGFRVIAPELPGFGDGTTAGPRTFGDYARWIERALDAMGVAEAWFVGNSFGAAVSWRLASQAPERCLGLVMVNGVPPPPVVPPLARWILANTPLGRLRRAAVRSILRRMGYGPTVLERAFADPSRAPREIATSIANRSSPQIELACDALLGDDEPRPPPSAPVLLLWGESDRLLGSNAKTARRLHDRVNGSQIALISSAGHLPQVERPSEFVDALMRFIATARGARAAREASGA